VRNSADPEQPVQAGEPSVPLWDVERLLESIGDDPAFVAELIDVFLTSTADNIGLLAAAPPADVVRIAHTVKGAAANIHAKKLATRAAELELAAQSRSVSASDLEGLRSAWADTEHVMRRYALRFADERTG
jgi:HPt (histidine-containing phosphotransfer) domain-containing protein